MGRSKKPTAAEMKKIRLVKMIQEVTSSGSSKDTWNPAEISEGLKNINFIRRLVDTWNPAQLNEAIRRLGFKTIDTWNPAIIDEMKAALIRIFALHSVTGNPITLNLTGELPYLIKDATVTFSPKQSGTGDPSPTNIRPISGWDGLNLMRTGKNLFDFSSYKNNISATRCTYSTTNNSVTITATQRDAYIINTVYKIVNKGQMTLSWSANNNDRGRVYVFCDGEPFVYADNDVTKHITFTPPDGTEFITIRLGVLDSGNILTYSNIQLEAESTATSYEPYQGETYTATFDETIYGGNYDFVSGDGSETWVYIAEYDGETLPGVWISDRDVYAPNTTPSTGAEVAYQLATPTPIELTGQEVEPLPGINVFSTDADTLNIKYQIDLS